MRRCNSLRGLAAPGVQSCFASTRRTFGISTISRDGCTLPKPRIDYKSISENSVYKSHNAFNRRAPVPLDAVKKITKLHQAQVRLSNELSRLKHERSLIGERLRTAPKGAVQPIKDEAAGLKLEIQAVEKELASTEDSLLTQALHLPNDTHPSTPLGPEEAAILLSTHGPPCTEASPRRDHVEINRALDFMDMQAGSLATGSSWTYLKNEGALLEIALTNYALSMAIKHGFTPVLTPDVVKEDLASRCGFQPRDEQGNEPSQNYYLHRKKDETQLVLSGTAEIPLASLCAGKVLERHELPQKFVGLGRAFRAEAGARGSDTRGLYRVHQFSKVELFVVCEASESEKHMEEVRSLQTKIFEGLNLSFRVLDMPSEELGASAYRKYDMEAWMPGRGSWGEISSLSNCTDYQSRRLHTRLKPPPAPAIEKGVRHGLPFAHTLNGTAAAIPRLIVALIENGACFNDRDEFSMLELPAVLQQFWLGDVSRVRFISKSQ